MYRTQALITPNTATIKHIMAAPLKFSFRRLVIYAPETRNILAVSCLSLVLPNERLLLPDSSFAYLLCLYGKMSEYI